MKKISKAAAAILLAALLIISVSGCGDPYYEEHRNADDDGTKFTMQLYAPASSLLAVSNLVHKYRKVADYAAIGVTYDEDTQVLADKINSGYKCDIFISDIKDYADILEENGRITDPQTVFKLTEYDESGNGTERIFYVAAVTNSKYADEAEKFIEFMRSDTALQIYTDNEFEYIEADDHCNGSDI